jgi:hypothetical protein
MVTIIVQNNSTAETLHRTHTATLLHASISANGFIYGNTETLPQCFTVSYMLSSGGSGQYVSMYYSETYVMVAGVPTLKQ